MTQPHDTELRALTRCWNLLIAFDGVTRARMLAWLSEKLQTLSDPPKITVSIPDDWSNRKDGT